nr:MAG TPA: hypothetical protein [Caudoviricetes sp.]
MEQGRVEIKEVILWAGLKTELLVRGNITRKTTSKLLCVSQKGQKRRSKRPRRPQGSL